MFLRSIKEWFYPPEADALRDLPFFQRRLTDILGFCCIGLGGPVIILSSLNRLQQGETTTAVVYLLLLGIFISLLFLRNRISTHIRASVFLSTIILGSLVSFVDLGFATSAPISFISVVFLASLFYGRLVGILVAMAISSLAIAVAFIHVSGTVPPDQQVTQLWVRYLIGFIAAALGTAWIMGWVGTSLQRTIERLSEQNVALEKARVEAEAGMRAKQDFISVMSHEMYTPLNPMRGYLDLILATDEVKSENREWIEVISTNVDHLRGLIKDILDYSQMDIGDEDLEPGQIKISEFIENTVELFRGEAAQKGLSLGFQLDPTLLENSVILDESHLKRVLLNLLSNAVKFTEHGKVSLIVGVRPGNGKSRLTFRIEDTGIGFPEEIKEQLWKPFEQMDQSNTRAFGGIGLGLAIAAKLTQKLGGELDCVRNAGGGSSFFFDIPFEIEGPQER